MKGLTKKQQNTVTAALEILETFAAYNPQSLTTSVETCDYLRLKLSDLEHEVFGVIFLNKKHDIIAWEIVSTGTIDGAPVYPREIVKRVLYHNACDVIFAHNHPSGVMDPSQSDILITRRLKAALDTIDVRVLDHIIIANTFAVSMLERGEL